MTTINDLIDRWNTDEGRPFKGSLIDMDAYEEDPSSNDDRNQNSSH